MDQATHQSSPHWETRPVRSHIRMLRFSWTALVAACLVRELVLAWHTAQPAHAAPMHAWWFAAGALAIWAGGWRAMQRLGQYVTQRFDAAREAESREVSISRRHDALVNQMLDGVVVYEAIRDGDGNACDFRIVSANPAFERITGRAVNEVLGKTILEVFIDSKEWMQELQQVLLTSQAQRFERWISSQEHLPNNTRAEDTHPTGGMIAG